jgi:hypothetical protein
MRSWSLGFRQILCFVVQITSASRLITQSTQSINDQLCINPVASYSFVVYVFIVTRNEFFMTFLIINGIWAISVGTFASTIFISTGPTDLRKTQRISLMSISLRATHTSLNSGFGPKRKVFVTIACRWLQSSIQFRICARNAFSVAPRIWLRTKLMKSFTLFGSSEYQIAWLGCVIVEFSLVDTNPYGVGIDLLVSTYVPNVACGSGVRSVVKSAPRTLSADGHDDMKRCSTGSRWSVSPVLYWPLGA